MHKGYDAEVEITRKAQTGRPREFDTDQALDQAVLLFWRQGYEGTSLSDLENAMGITRKSVYAAFGNKEELFRKVLQRYSEGFAAYGLESLRQPTAREVATAFLNGSVETSTRPGGPAGCLGVAAALTVGAANQPIQDALRTWRDDGQAALRERFQRAIDERDLPANADAGSIAQYVMTVSNGIAVQALGGATRDELRRVAVAALKNWPPA